MGLCVMQKAVKYTFVSDICVAQGDLRLLYWIGKDGVVIEYLDENDKNMQYQKKLLKDNLIS